MPPLTVCLTNWRRPKLLKRLIGELVRQTVRPVLFLWDNDGGFRDRRVDWIVSSSKNAVCWPRWLMASCATTECCCVIDDDVRLTAPDALAAAIARLQRYPAHTIVGLEGVTLLDGRPYGLARHVRIHSLPSRGDVTCDLIKGQFMLMRTRALCERVPLGALDERREDDIAVSGLMAEGRRGQHRCLSALRTKMSLIDAPHALSRQPGHYGRRDAACARFFQRHSGR